MARKRKKKALYEVIGRTLSKPGSSGAGQRLGAEESGKDESAVPKSERVSRWPRRPRMVQFNAGRIEISIPYQLAIALLLGVILVILVFFRLGQKMSYSGERESTGSAAGTENIGRSESTGSDTTETTLTDETSEPVGQERNNRVVIQTCQLRTQLEPVKQYYGSFGIETEIRKIGDWYYLVTKDKYENPEKRGTDGYFAKQKIIELGAKYKAPPGYETFAKKGKKPFYDAYGMRFDD